MSLLLACGGGSGSGDNDPNNGHGDRRHSASGESWTVMIYMAADNDLESFALDDLGEMMQVGTGEEFNLVVQADRALMHAVGGVGDLPEWVSAKRLLVRSGQLEELADLGEPNMGDPAVLTDFVSWAVKEFPADRYALIFWNHGAGWPGFGGDDSTANHDLLTLTELRDGLSSGMERAGLEQLALIGFDACLMATYEVAAVLSPFGEYLLASEELEPGHGWDYRSLSGIRADPSQGPIDLATAWMDGFLDQAREQKEAQQVTLSLTDLYALDDLDSALVDLSALLIDDLSVSAPHVGRQHNVTLRFAKAPNPAHEPHMIDIGDFASHLMQGDKTFAELGNRIHMALEKAVVKKIAGPQTTRAQGLSIYFPPRAEFYKSDYAHITEAAAWRDFLLSYYDMAVSGSFTPPRFTNPQRMADYQFVPDEIILTGNLDSSSASNVSGATLGYGVIGSTSNYIYLLADEPAHYTNTTVDARWDYSILTITQGFNFGYLYMSFDWSESSDLVLSIPFEYWPPGQSSPEYAILVYILDQNFYILQETYYVLTDSGPGELTPEFGSVIRPLVLTIDPQGKFGWGYGSEAGFDPLGDFQLDFLDLPQGTPIYAELSIADFAGNEDYVYFEGDVQAVPAGEGASGGLRGDERVRRARAPRHGGYLPRFGHEQLDSRRRVPALGAEIQNSKDRFSIRRPATVL
ncbi:MAG: clostripain-related cysteine peptidase [Proteobacteria bacterium]|nr:clostripain-related cysteine peptidase [Pseudomonadota bacterium]